MQEDLFTYKAHNYTDTSKQSYEKSLPKQKTIRDQIFQYITSQPSTNEQISNELNIKLQTVCARVRELQILNLIEDSGKRGKTASNRTAIIWQNISQKF